MNFVLEEEIEKFDDIFFLYELCKNKDYSFHRFFGEFESDRLILMQVLYLLFE